VIFARDITLDIASYSTVFWQCMAIPWEQTRSISSTLSTRIYSKSSCNQVLAQNSGFGTRAL